MSIGGSERAPFGCDGAIEVFHLVRGIVRSLSRPSQTNHRFGADIPDQLNKLFKADKILLQSAPGIIWNRRTCIPASNQLCPVQEFHGRAAKTDDARIHLL